MATTIKTAEKLIVGGTILNELLGTAINDSNAMWYAPLVATKSVFTNFRRATETSFNPVLGAKK